jgi:hypothetical protein
MSEQKLLMIPEQQYNFLATLIESKKLPGHVKTVEDAFTIGQMGRELGFATMQAFHYIIPIQGKLSLSAKAISALLRKGGVKFTTMEDGVYVYKNGSTSELRIETEKPVDRRTTIVFERGDQTEKTSFSWTDAIGQELHSKANWVKMPKEMLWARCLSKGANRIGADLLLGLYSTEEMFDVFGGNTNVKRDEDGQIVEIVEADAEIIE